MRQATHQAAEASFPVKPVALKDIIDPADCCENEKEGSADGEMLGNTQGGQLFKSILNQKHLNNFEGALIKEQSPKKRASVENFKTGVDMACGPSDRSRVVSQNMPYRKRNDENATKGRD